MVCDLSMSLCRCAGSVDKDGVPWKATEAVSDPTLCVNSLPVLKQLCPTQRWYASWEQHWGECLINIYSHKIRLCHPSRHLPVSGFKTFIFNRTDICNAKKSLPSVTLIRLKEHLVPHNFPCHTIVKGVFSGAFSMTRYVLFYSQAGCESFTSPLLLLYKHITKSVRLLEKNAWPLYLISDKAPSDACDRSEVGHTQG